MCWSRKKWELKPIRPVSATIHGSLIELLSVLSKKFNGFLRRTRSNTVNNVVALQSTSKRADRARMNLVQMSEETAVKKLPQAGHGFEIISVGKGKELVYNACDVKKLKTIITTCGLKDTKALSEATKKKVLHDELINMRERLEVCVATHYCLYLTH